LPSSPLTRTAALPSFIAMTRFETIALLLLTGPAL
jgi:hypothetical protein